MNVIVICPECASRIRVMDEHVGKRVRCPRCDQFFDAHPNENASPVTLLPDPIPEPAPPRIGLRELPRRMRVEPSGFSAKDSHAWESVLTAINLQLASLALALLGGLVMGGAPFLASSRAPTKSAEAQVASRLVDAGYLSGSILTISGWIVSMAAGAFALAGPTSRGLRPLAGFGLALSLLICTNLGSWPATMDVASRPSGLIARHLSALSFVSILEAARLTALPLFVRSLGQQLRERDLMQSARRTLWIVAGLLALGIGAGFMAQIARGPAENLAIADAHAAGVGPVMMALVRCVAICLSGYLLLLIRPSVTQHVRETIRAEIP